jgi:germination protein M
MTLAAEERTLPLPENDAAALGPALRELVKGPRNPALLAVLPEDTELRAAYLLPDGNAVIDLGGPTLAGGWNSGSHDELMAIHSIIETAMANFDSVRRVRLLINGQVAETLGGHIRIDRPLDRALFAAAAKR